MNQNRKEIVEVHQHFAAYRIASKMKAQINIQDSISISYHDNKKWGNDSIRVNAKVFINQDLNSISPLVNKDCTSSPYNQQSNSNSLNQYANTYQMMEDQYKAGQFKKKYGNDNAIDVDFVNNVNGNIITDPSLMILGDGSDRMSEFGDGDNNMIITGKSARLFTPPSTISTTTIHDHTSPLPSYYDIIAKINNDAEVNRKKQINSYFVEATK